MLRPGDIVILGRVRQPDARVRVLERDPRGCWVGMECLANRRVRDGIPPLRLFHGSEVRTARVAEGFQAVLPGVLS
jgi:hypothetical protein